ncbi:MAG: hypothetical protein U9N38_03500 [Thermodesulfobacteriota bacterium]|nr:hypothetical protein [Thermodesulfobacteriota bacterium]
MMLCRWSLYQFASWTTINDSVALFGLNDDTALLAPVTDVTLVRCFNLIKIIVFSTMYLKTLGAISSVQFVGVDGQMAVPALEHIFLFWQLDKGEVSA